VIFCSKSTLSSDSFQVTVFCAGSVILWCRIKARDAGHSSAMSKEQQRGGGATGWHPAGTRKRCWCKIPLLETSGGDLDSTRVMKPKVHAELQTTRKTDCKTLVANDDNYALAA
jgi:hypothetical protein